MISCNIYECSHLLEMLSEELDCVLFSCKLKEMWLYVCFGGI